MLTHELSLRSTTTRKAVTGANTHETGGQTAHLITLFRFSKVSWEIFSTIDDYREE